MSYKITPSLTHPLQTVSKVAGWQNKLRLCDLSQKSHQLWWETQMREIAKAFEQIIVAQMPEDAIAREKLLRMGVFVGFQEG
jgi:hypothetical protein